MIISLLKRCLAVLAIISLVMTAYLLLARPYQLHWGATNHEQQQSMPGDQLDSTPDFFATRAITIAGTPQEIWPWLLQMGYGRAGYYGYDILENYGSPRGIDSARNILPEFQQFKVGDEVPISPAARLVFSAIEPNEYLIWSGADKQSSFLWALYPIDSTHTRLVSRIRLSFHWTQPGVLMFELFTEFADHVAVREILTGVKGRVENGPRPSSDLNTEFVVYVLSFLTFITALVLGLIRPLTRTRWLLGLVSGLAWLIVWYAPIPIWASIGVVAIIVHGMYIAFRRDSRQKTIRKT